MWSSMINDQWSLRALLSFANLFLFRFLERLVRSLVFFPVKILFGRKSTKIGQNTDLRISRESPHRYCIFLVIKCKTTILNSRREPNVYSFSISGDIWAQRSLQWHNLMSPSKKLNKKYFFCQTIINGPSQFLVLTDISRS